MAGLNQWGMFGFKVAGLVLRPDKTSKFGHRGLGVKTVDITDFGDKPSGIDLANSGDGSKGVRDNLKLLFNGLVQYHAGVFQKEIVYEPLLFAQMKLDLVDSLKRSLMRDQPKGKLHWPTWQKLKLRALSRFRRDNRWIIKDYLDVISAGTDEPLRDQFADAAAETAADYKDTISQTLPENPDPSSDQPITRIPDQSFFSVNERRMNALLEDTQKLERNCARPSEWKLV